MKNTILLCALIAFFLTGNTARAETKTCKIEIKGSTVTWKGPCRDGKAYGNGRAEGANWVYEGAAHGGKARGQGTWKLDDGGSYSGAWREGVPHGVEGAERLVHQQQIRIMNKRAAKADTLLHPAGKLVLIGILEAIERDQLNQLLRRLPIVLDAQAPNFDLEENVLQYRTPSHE